MGEWPSREFEPPAPEEGVPEEAAVPAVEREAAARDVEEEEPEER